LFNKSSLGPLDEGDGFAEALSLECSFLLFKKIYIDLFIMLSLFGFEKEKRA